MSVVYLYSIQNLTAVAVRVAVDLEHCLCQGISLASATAMIAAVAHLVEYSLLVPWEWDFPPYPGPSVEVLMQVSSAVAVSDQVLMSRVDLEGPIPRKYC